MSIQRYGPVWTGDESCSIVGNATGEYVLYEDHVKSVNMAAMKAYAYLTLNGNRDAAEKISQIILEEGR